MIMICLLVAHDIDTVYSGIVILTLVISKDKGSELMYFTDQQLI